MWNEWWNLSKTDFDHPPHNKAWKSRGICHFQGKASKHPFWGVISCDDYRVISNFQIKVSKRLFLKQLLHALIIVSFQIPKWKHGRISPVKIEHDLLYENALCGDYAGTSHFQRDKNFFFSSKSPKRWLQGLWESIKMTAF